MGLRRVFVLAIGMAALTLGLAVPAGADPVNAKKGEILEIECDVLGSLEIAVNGNGQWTPGHVVGSTQVGIPYAFRFVFVPDGGEAQVEESSKPQPRNGRYDVCTFGGEEEGGTFTATVWITYTKTRV